MAHSEDNGGCSPAGRVILTGSAGFIGGHLTGRWNQSPGLACVDRVVPETGEEAPHMVLDLGDEQGVAKADLPRGGVVLHLAAEAEVEMPFDRMNDLVDSNLKGTLNVLSHWRPQHLVFTSTSAVYGNGPRTGSTPDWEEVRPVGLYGMSKVMGEWACAARAREDGMSAVILRLGNVVGANCRGFVPYLVKHALLHPEGDVPARARGQGRMVRDYVPVHHVAEVIRRTALFQADSGSVRTLNVGSGKPMTNGQVGEVVRQFLEGEGYRLDIRWDSPPVAGEAESVVLHVDETLRSLDLPRPTRDEIEAAIAEGVRSWLAHFQARKPPASAGSVQE